MRKPCPGCGRSLPLSEFNTDNSRRDGLTVRCWECRADHFRARYHTDPAVRDRIRDRSRRYQRDRYVPKRATES